MSIDVPAGMRPRLPGGFSLPPLGMHLVMGEAFADKRRHSTQALRDGRIVFVQGLFSKPA